MTDLDHELGAIAAGDAGAFGRWLAGAEHELRSSLRPVAALVDTEAIQQEALLRVWQVAPRFVPDGRPNGLLRLAVTIARNLVRSELRRARPELAEPMAIEDALAVESRTEAPCGPDPFLRRAIEECRGKLPSRPAQALHQRLSSAGAEPDGVLAERLGMKLNTFLQNFTRARKLLSDCLKGKRVNLEAEL